MKLTRPTIKAIGELIEGEIAQVEGVIWAHEVGYRTPPARVRRKHRDLLRVRRQWARFVASQEKKRA